eukprot:gene11243-biopygen16849
MRRGERENPAREGWGHDDAGRHEYMGRYAAATHRWTVSGMGSGRVGATPRGAGRRRWGLAAAPQARRIWQAGVVVVAAGADPPAQPPWLGEIPHCPLAGPAM